MVAVGSLVVGKEYSEKFTNEVIEQKNVFVFIRIKREKKITRENSNFMTNVLGWRLLVRGVWMARSMNPQLNKRTVNGKNFFPILCLE
jgi:cellobiose phosphorylase